MNNGIKKWIRWLKNDRLQMIDTIKEVFFESHSLILIVLVGSFVGLTGAFLFAILEEKWVKFLPTLVK